MRIIVSGGGTGGHIYPAITLIKAIKSLRNSCEILYIGTNEGLEADIIPKEGLPFATIEVRGLAREISLKNVATVLKTFGSLWQSRRLISQFKPDVVIGTGGYVCGPVLLAASLMGIPTMIQEQNVVPGITNRILAKFVDKIAVGYADAAKHFNRSAKVVFTGNPIRPEVLSALREEGMSKLGLDPKKKTILISGGSRGARSINTAMIQVHKHYAGNKNIQLLHVTGKNEYNDIVGNLMQIGIDTATAGNIIIKPYLYDMPNALAATDLAIFRAGAIGLAELTSLGIPSILIPYPYAAENHQEFNARVMEHQGAAVVIKDNELNGEKLTKVVDGLIFDNERLKVMAKASKSLGRPDAAEQIARMAILLSNSR
ncbi:undecaprenyldiphospho-muramoylpentapeptide beta-N-acetylglucosaminyltransferase [Dendrosporobacter sp. 1207_IL3150]|uniref:undecaprenyldiphospho-muramoylpentapeptide beta-N-acetylglucosaminyltransferase n=1 Tax=Dendrosporobacter sp. 1207_IL3150 TaxID=3084054 RepID=UPI002FD9B7CB